MKNDSYLVVEESALPEVYQKVVKANALLESGEGFHRLRSGAKGRHLPQCLL